MSEINEGMTVSDEDLATLRRHGFGVAYRMLGRSRRRRTSRRSRCCG